jgi:tRNA(Arg) A34 adenosine deaminase TadA
MFFFNVLLDACLLCVGAFAWAAVRNIAHYKLIGHAAGVPSTMTRERM